jgi:hypothetical protein
MKKIVAEVMPNTYWVFQPEMPVRVEFSNLTDCKFVLSVESFAPGVVRIAVHREGTKPEHTA